MNFQKDRQYYKFCGYGFFKNLRFFDPFLMLFFVDKGLNYAEIGTLYAIREVTVNALEVPSGFLADILGRKRAMITSFFAYIISFLLFYQLMHYWGFILAFLFYGIGDAFRTGTHKSMILAYIKSKGWEAAKTDYYGRTRSWSQRGSAIAAIISAGVVFITGDYNTVFLFSIVPYIINVILLSSYPSWLNGVREKKKESVKELFRTSFLQLKSTFSSFATFRAIVFTSGFTGYYKAAKDYLQPMLMAAAVTIPMHLKLEENQKTAVIIGVVYSSLFFLTAKASRSAGYMERRFNKTEKALTWLQGIGFLVGLLAGVAYYMDLRWLAIIFFIGILITQNLRRPVVVSYLSDRFDDQIMATALSAESQSETLFTALFALTFGLFINYFGVGPGLSLVSFILLLGFIVLNGIKSKRK